MKILEKGQPKEIQFPKQYKCGYCNSVLEYERKDVKMHQPNFMQYLLGASLDATIICPNCKKEHSVIYHLLS